MGGWSTALKMGGRAVRFAGHNPKTFLGLSAGSVAGWKYFVNDESLLEQATEVALGDDASKGLKENGVTGGLKGLAFGADGADKSIGENVVDGVVGEGTYDHITHAAGNAVDTVENGLHAAGQGIQNAYQGTDQMVQGYQQQAIMPQQGGGQFSALNPFNGIGQLASSFWNGGSGMSLAALIPAAFLMFGNFGWMGKIASLFLGSLAMKNMRMQQTMIPQQQIPYGQGYQVQTVEQPLQQQHYQPQLAQNESEENEHTIRRGRG